MTASSTDPFISVVLCTYNPRADYLQRVIEGLKAQTLPREQWEFVVVDNNSQPPLALRDDCERDNFKPSSSETAPRHIPKDTDDSADNVKISKSQIEPVQLDLGWHADTRLVVETHQGLSHARRRGFEEARGGLIVNLDDDAVLDPNYLEEVLKLAEQFPFIGAFGCALIAEFEEPPTKPPDEYYAALRIVEQSVWSNDPLHHASNPWGAGSVVRRYVAKEYVRRLAADKRYSRIGRTGKNLLACEDDDIAMTACDLGLGKGVFPTLRLTHLVKASQMTEDFQCRNAFGHAYSGTMLEFLRFGRRPARPTLRARLNRAYRLACMKSRRRQQEIARDQGVKEAARDMKQWGWL